MDNAITLVLGTLLTLSIAISIYFYLKIKNIESSPERELNEIEAIKKASKIAKDKLLESERKASEIEKEAKNLIEKEQKHLKELELDLQKQENKILQRTKVLDEKVSSVEKKENEIDSLRSTLKEKQAKVEAETERIAKLTKEEAEAELRKKVEAEMSDWTLAKISESEKEIKAKVKELSKQLLIDTMSQSAVDFVADTTTSIVDIKDESMKSRIIGKSGRNIRTFERMTGVDIIIDESPTEITLSSFDPIRREVAAITMRRLIASGKINPAEIEDTVQKVKKDMLKEIRKLGDELVREVGVSDLPQEIIMLLGRFKFRYLHGQNLLKQTLELVKLSEFLANELGVDKDSVIMTALLSNIGKVSPQEDKSFRESSTDIIKRYLSRNTKTISALEALEKDHSQNAIAEIIRIAENISQSRPGAKKDNYDDYVKRARAIEDMALENKAVKEAFAVKAANEIRVLVKPEDSTDQDIELIAYNIAREIERKQQGGNPVKVTVIRESRKEADAK